MKKSNTYILIILSGLLLFSCTNGLTIPKQEASEKPEETVVSVDGKTYITLGDVSLDENARTINPVFEKSRFENVDFKGTHEGKVVTFETSGKYPAMLSKRYGINPGEWTFTISGTVNGVAYNGSVTKTIETGTTNQISILLQPTNPVEYGGFDIKVVLDGFVDNVNVILRKGSSQGQLIEETTRNPDGNNEFSYARLLDSSEKLPAGKYYLTFEFEAEGLVVNTVENIVRVVNNFNTTTTLNINVNEPRSVNYKVFANDDTQILDVQNGALPSGVDFADPSNGVLPEYYVKNFTLPPLKKNGYVFAGWYTDFRFEDNKKITVLAEPPESGEVYALFVNTLFVEVDGQSNGLVQGNWLGSIASAIEKIKTFTGGENVDFTVKVNQWLEGAQTISGISTTQARSITLTGFEETGGNEEPENSLEGRFSDSNHGTTLTIDTAVPVTITNLKIEGGNQKLESGDGTAGGISIASGSNVTIGHKVLVQSNSANQGGGIYVNHAVLTIDGNAVIKDNSTDHDGGNIYACNYAKIYMTGGDITEGYISGRWNAQNNMKGAGVMLVSHSEFAMSAGYIRKNKIEPPESNTFKGCGAGVYVEENSKFSITGGSISENWIDTSLWEGIMEGGAVWIGGNSVFEIGGAASIPAGAVKNEVLGLETGPGLNDVFLGENQGITITKAFDNTSDKISIVFQSYIFDSSVLTAAQDVTLSAQAGKFSVSPQVRKINENRQITTEWQIKNGKLWRNLGVGDVLLNDGTYAYYPSFTSDQISKAVGVIYKLDASGNPEGIVGLRNTGEGNHDLPAWAPSSTTGYSTQFTDIICTPIEDQNTHEYTFTGDEEGNDNWFYISKTDPEGAANAAVKYPAFNYVNNYAQTAGLTGNYAEGWYMPSVSEMYDIAINLKILNDTLTSLGSSADTLPYKEYWTSSQSGTEHEEIYAWTIEISDNTYNISWIRSCFKDDNYHPTCCVRAASALPKYSVVFDSNGGSSVQSQKIEKGQTATQPSTPTRSGKFKFDGWYSDKALTQQFVFSTQITENIVLYAKWSVYYSVGDLILNDGTRIRYEDISSQSSTTISKAAGIIYDIDELGNARGILGIKNSGDNTNSSESEKYLWASGRTGLDEYISFTTIISEPGYENELGIYVIEGDTNGSDNWTEICTADPTGTANAQTYYPAFYYVNQYVTNSRLNGSSYSTGWYMPSLMELYCIYLNKDVLHQTIEAINNKVANLADPIAEVEYWSSSQSGVQNYDVVTIKMDDEGGFRSTNKTENGYGICCVHLIETPTTW